ncbi:acetyltransferase [Vibrio anguillarum]|uniref:Acetyltransferase n=2 Tax=Vibrio anguillarum TaxID=55601 RepID=A0A7U6FUA0_VIBAN|nr:acetyltransferase [Vibrio anguillarum]MBF4308369.1 acetyltransferase [Vibrio anguillarum]MBF4326293.1 acetyltransferase [Vibrio anguillarum]
MTKNITNGSRGTANAWRFLFKSAFVITVVILGSAVCVVSPLTGRYALVTIKLFWNLSQ